MRHHENEELLRYVDGELPARAAGKIRSHLEACWQCRAERDELENTVGECVSYRKTFLQQYLPSPPAPWIDIYQGFAEIDASTESGIFSRMLRLFQWPALNVRRWAVAATVLLVIAGLFYRFRQTPSVEAAELLRKAVAAADAQPVKARHIRIRTRQHSITRVTGAQATAIAADGDRDTVNSLQTLFVAAHYDWNDPLSARSYQAWRNQLVDKRDEVTPDQDAYRLRTDTSAGELASATLKLHVPDLRPVEERLEFRNQEWVEITELAEEAPATTAGVTARGDRPVSPLATPESSSTNMTPIPAPVAAATVGDELQVFRALHQLGADLGDPIEVSLTGGKVLVSGVGIPPQRQQEISEALGSKPQVLVRFSESEPASTVQPQKETTAESSISADVRQLQSKIAQQVGGRVYFDQLAAQVLDLSESMMSRAYALRRLAERFPTSAEGELSAQDLQLLRKLQQEHTAALRVKASEIDRVLRPVLGPVNGKSHSAPPAPGLNAEWQPATEDVFQSARQVEKLLAGMFGAAPLEAADQQLPARLMTSLTQLEGKLELYNGLITQPSERRDR